MKSILSEIAGGLALMLVATLVGIAVNAARPNGVALIQSGAPVATASHQKPAAGADSASATAPLPEGAISVDEMKAILDAGVASIIDARSDTEYAEGHIPGAINVPHDRLPEFIEMLTGTVATDAEVIVYCRSLTCDFSDLLATEMKILGYNNVRVFAGGMDHWKTAGHPVTTGATP